MNLYSRRLYIVYVASMCAYKLICICWLSESFPATMDFSFSIMDHLGSEICCVLYARRHSKEHITFSTQFTLAIYTLNSQSVLAHHTRTQVTCRQVKMLSRPIAALFRSAHNNGSKLAVIASWHTFLGFVIEIAQQYSDLESGVWVWVWVWVCQLYVSEFWCLWHYGKLIT